MQTLKGERQRESLEFLEDPTKKGHMRESILAEKMP